MNLYREISIWFVPMSLILIMWAEYASHHKPLSKWRRFLFWVAIALAIASIVNWIVIIMGIIHAYTV